MKLNLIWPHLQLPLIELVIPFKIFLYYLEHNTYHINIGSYWFIGQLLPSMEIVLFIFVFLLPVQLYYRAGIPKMFSAWLSLYMYLFSLLYCKVPRWISYHFCFLEKLISLAIIVQFLWRLNCIKNESLVWEELMHLLVKGSPDSIFQILYFFTVQLLWLDIILIIINI